MNSRYRLGTRTEDWLKLSLRADAPQGMMGRMLGRGDKLRRVED